MDYLKLSPIKYDKECEYLHNLDDQNNDQFKENIRDLGSMGLTPTRGNFLFCHISVSKRIILYIIFIKIKHLRISII